MTISQAKEHMTAMMHSGSLAKVRNILPLFERASMALLGQIRPPETIRTATLSQFIHDDLNNYPLPSDFGGLLDLYPQDSRTSLDGASRGLAERFDRRKGLDNKVFSIEGSEGSRFIRINWKSKAAKLFHNMNSLTANGTVAIVATASGLKINTQYKVSGSGSVEFDVAASGDGIQITGATAIDLSEWDELADIIIPVFLGSVANLTSITPIFGNDLTTAYWTCVAQTAQADGTAFRVGWNYIKAPWSTATETGTVDPTAIDSFKLTFTVTGALSNIRVDNILFSLGRVFDIKYYSKYLFKNSAGTFISVPTDDTDTIVLEQDSLYPFLCELLRLTAQQVEGEDSGFDIAFAESELFGNPRAIDPKKRIGAYAYYRSQFRDQTKKEVGHWASGPRFQN